MNDGLQAAWNRKWRIFQWALLAATVGMLLKMLERRLRLLGRIITGMIGFVWTLASFFVVPVLAAEDMGPFEALYKSSQLIRETWGEEVVGGTPALIQSLCGLVVRGVSLHVAKTLGDAGLCDKEESSPT